MTALIVTALIVCGGMTALAIEHRLRRTHAHMRPVRYHDDARRWARFGKAIDKEPRT